LKVALSAAKERFFTGYALWKACNGQNVRIFAQMKFSNEKDETFWTRQVVDYSIKSKGYFGKDKSKEESLVKFWSFLKAEY
jgi:hypothetical protein